jgi:hypothetical protein
MDGEDGTPEKPPQGWFADPFGVHEARWFSQGKATALVRDGRAEAQDPPPDRAFDLPLVPARTASSTGPRRPPSDDLRPAGDDPSAPEPRGRSDFSGHSSPLGAGTVPAVFEPPGSGDKVIDPRSAPPPTPKRILRIRWITFGFACVWTALLAGLLFTATTTVRTGAGAGRHAEVRTVFSTDRVGVILFVAVLVAICAVTGVSLFRRIRRRDQAPSRVGYVCAGILVAFGVLSLASLGLALVVLGAAVGVVSLPIRRPRPLPGEPVV